jgi:hypothetical protein
MGATFVGIRECPLQRGLGRTAFVEKLRLLGQQRAAEKAVPDQERRAKMQIRVRIGDHPPRTTTYAELVAATAEIAGGIPECRSCPLSDGRAVACHTVISYPVDAAFERELFRFVVDGLSTKGSLGDRFYREILVRFEGPPTDWLMRRGTEPGCLASLAEPLIHRWRDRGEMQTLSSADLLDGVFATYDERTDVMLQCGVLIAIADAFESLADASTAEAVRRVAKLAREIIEREGWTLLVDA